WDLAHRREAHRLSLAAWARAADFSADGALLAAAGDDGRLHVWDAATWRELHDIRDSREEIWSVRFAPRGTLVAAAGNDGQVRLWDAATGKLQRAFDAGQGKVRAVGFSPDGKLLATAGTDDTARVWHADSGIEALQLRGH